MSDWTPPADAKKATPAASGWKPPSDAKKADGAPFPSAPPASGEEGLGGPAVSQGPSTNGYAPQPRHLETGGLRPFKGLDAAAPRRPQMTPTALSPNRGTREDGTNKGPGWLGSIPAADGKEMTELSFDFDVDGKNIFAPLLVPTLSEGEVALLASGGEPTDAIYKKAQDFAIQRLDQGKSPFKEDPRSIVKKEKAEEIDLIGADRTTQQPSTIQAPQFDITPATAKQKKKAEEDARIEDRYQSEFSSATEEEVQKAKSVNQSMRSSIPAMEGAFLEGVERLKQQGQLLTDQRQILDSMDPSDPAYQDALDQYNERVKAFRKEQSGIELEALVVDDLVKKSAIDEFLLNRREHAIKAGHGNIPAAMGYASLDMLGKSMAGTLDVIGKVIPTDQEILEFAGALPEGSGTESRKEWRNYLKDVEKAPTRLTGIDQFVTPEYVDKKKDESLFASGLIAIAEMAPAIAAGMATGGAGMGATFFMSSYRDLDQEMQGEYWDQIPEAEKEAIKVGTSFVSAGLSTMGMKALAGNLPVVNNIFFRAARKFAPGMSPGQLRRIIDAETKSYVANVTSRLVQGFAIEGTEELADYGQEELVKHLYENYKRDEFGEKADTLFQNAESIDQLGEGAWKSFVIGGIAGNMIGGSVAALSSVGARKRLNEKEFGVFKDLLESGSLLKDIEPIMAAQVAAGEMSQSDFDKTMEDVSKAESAISQIPEGLDIKATREAFDLLLEKDKLKTKDKILAAPKMQKIDEKLQALVGVPKEEEAKTEPTKKKAGAPDTPSKTVEWEGKDVQPKEQVTTPNENERTKQPLPGNTGDQQVDGTGESGTSSPASSGLETAPGMEAVAAGEASGIVPDASGNASGVSPALPDSRGDIRAESAPPTDTGTPSSVPAPAPQVTSAPTEAVAEEGVAVRYPSLRDASDNDLRILRARLSKDDTATDEEKRSLSGRTDRFLVKEKMGANGRVVQGSRLPTVQEIDNELSIRKGEKTAYDQTDRRGPTEIESAAKDISYGRLSDQQRERYSDMAGSSVPEEAMRFALAWNEYSKSPYGSSYYSTQQKDWNNTPDGSYRIADHWNFQATYPGSDGKKSSTINSKTDVPVKGWAIGRYDAKSREYKIIKQFDDAPSKKETPTIPKEGVKVVRMTDGKRGEVVAPHKNADPKKYIAVQWNDGKKESLPASDFGKWLLVDETAVQPKEVAAATDKAPEGEKKPTPTTPTPAAPTEAVADEGVKSGRKKVWRGQGAAGSVPSEQDGSGEEGASTASVQDEAPKPVAKKEAPSPGQGEGTTKSPYHSTSGKKYGGFSVTYDPEIGKMKTTMLGTPPPSGAEKFPAGSKERAKKSSNRIKAIRKARQEAEDELARKLGIAKDGRFERGSNALEKREEEKERRAAISKKADRLDEDALGVYGVVLRVMADGDMKITPESIAKYLGWGGGRNDGAMAERRKTEEETKASWTLDDGGEHINNAAHGMMEGSTMKDADGDPMDGWSEADFAEAIAQVASGYTSSQEAYVQLERMADDLTEATLSPEDAITAHENAILNGLMEDADVEGNLDAAQASILNMSDAQLEAQYQDYLNTQRDENQEDTDGNDNQGAADSALGEQDDSGEEGASTATENFTEASVINRDYADLKELLGEKGAKKYFKQVDQLFNPNKTKVVEYRENGVVTEKNGVKTFHALADTNSKKWRVAFSNDIETIVPSQDKEVGVNDAGDKLYERKDGSVYRWRTDREKDRPGGYPDFGGDLSPVSTATEEDQDLADRISKLADDLDAPMAQRQSPERTALESAVSSAQKALDKALKDINKRGQSLFGDQEGTDQTSIGDAFDNSTENYDRILGPLRARLAKAKIELAKYDRDSAAGEAAQGALFQRDDYQGGHRPSENGPQAHDILFDNGEWVAPDDILGPNAARYYGGANIAEAQKAIAILRAIQGNPEAEVTIYRAGPKNELNDGDWITLTKGYAKEHAKHPTDPKKDDPVHSFKVKAKEIRWAGDDLNEFGYFPSEAKAVAQKSTSTTTEKTGKLRTDRVAAALKKLVPNLEIIAPKTKEEYAEATKDISEGLGSTWGIYDPRTNKLYLNPSSPDLRQTFFHEAAHPIIIALAKNNPELFSKFYEQIRTEKGGKYIKFGQQYSDLSEAAQMAEALAEFFGDVAAGKVPVSTKPDSLYQQFKDFIKDILAALGWDMRSIDLSKPTDVREFAAQMKKAFDKGIAIEGFAPLEGAGQAMAQSPYGPIPTDTHKAALNAVAASVRAGEGLSKATAKGLKEVKASDWYKALDATQRAQVEADFKAPIKALATPVDKKPSTAPKKLQKQVMEAVGKKPAPKIVVNEKAALKDQIRMAAKNIRGERTRIAAARKEFVAAIKEAFKGSNGDFTAKQAAVVAHRAASVDPTNDLQVSRFLDYANKVIDNAEWADQVERADIMRGRAAKASKRKSVPYNHKEVLKRASEVDPAILDNPGEYTDIVQRYLGNIASPLSSQYAGTEQITEGEFQKYLSEWEAQMDQKYEDLLMDELGITVKKGQAKEIYKSIQEGTIDEALRQMDDPKLKAEIESRVREMSQQRIAALKQHDTSGLDKEEVRIVKDIASADIDRLTVAQQADIIRASDNIILNNGFGGATLAASIASASNAVKPALDIAAKSGIRRALGIAQEFFSQSDAWTFFFGQAKDVGRIQNLVGFGDYVRGKAEFMKEQKKVRQDMEQFFSRLRAKYKDADSFENMTAEWVAGWVIQAMPKLNPKQSFEANKAMLQEDINRKMPTKSKKEAEMAQTVFDKIIAPANSREEALALLAKNYPSAKQSIDFMVNLFKPYRDRIQANSVRTWNMSGDYSDPYYLPKAFFKRGAKSLDVEPYSNKKNLTTMRPGQAGGTKARMTYRSLAENRLISPNIRNNVFSSLSDDLYGVATDAARMRLNEFMKMPDSNGVFGNEENKGFMAAMMHNYITAQDKSSGDQSKVSRWVNNRINDARTLASVQALAGFTQITRQLPEAVTQASVMMGRDFPLLFKNIPEVTVPSSLEGQGAANLMGNYAIGSREHAKAGMAWEGKVNSLNNAFQKAMQSGRVREAMKIRAKIQEVFMMSLMKGDLLSARAAWLGFYEKARKMDGHEVESWQTEASMHEGDASRQDAALYADTMVNRMTVSSDPAQAAKIARRGNNPWENASKSVLQAFVGTAIQQVGRRYAEVSTLGGYAYKKATGQKTGEAYDPKRALMSLVAGTTGNAVFLGSRLLIASALREAIGELYKWAVDDDDDEEPSAKAKTVFGVMTALYMAGMMDSDIFRAIDKVERDRGLKPKDPESESVKKYKLFKSQMLSEFIGSSIWQIADDLFIDGLNRMAYSAALDAGEPSAFTKGGDPKPFRTWLQDPKNAPFYRYGQTEFIDRDRWLPDLDDAGILGVYTKNAGYVIRNYNNIFGNDEVDHKNEYQKAVKDIREASKERTEKASDIVARYEAGELTKEQSNKEFEKAFKDLPKDEYNKAARAFLDKRRYADAPDNVKEVLDINSVPVRVKMVRDMRSTMNAAEKKAFDSELRKANVMTDSFLKEYKSVKK